jgi:hypothetical protein
MERECHERPGTCKQLVYLDMKNGPDHPSAWSTKLGPSYREWFDLEGANALKALTIKWTGLEYYAEVGRIITDQMDSGTLDPRDGWRLMYKASQQAKEMMGEEAQSRIQELRSHDAEAAMTASLGILNMATIALSTYASTQNIRPLWTTPAASPPSDIYTAPRAAPRTMPPPVSPPPYVTPRPATPVTPAQPTASHCTYRLWALGGRMLCTMPDGSVRTF